MLWTHTAFIAISPQHRSAQTGYGPVLTCLDRHQSRAGAYWVSNSSCRYLTRHRPAQTARDSIWTGIEWPKTGAGPSKLGSVWIGLCQLGLVGTGVGRSVSLPQRDSKKRKKSCILTFLYKIFTFTIWLLMENLILKSIVWAPFHVPKNNLKLYDKIHSRVMKL